MLERSPSLATSATRLPGPLGVLGRVLVALTCFVLVVAAMGVVAAPGGGSVIGGKLQYWDRHAHEYDTVFVGSSHVFRAFVPAEFDRAAADLGVETSSFNFGVQAVQLIEQRYLLRQILAAHPGLERVFFEYQWLCPQVDPENSFSPRTVYWHDWNSTALAVERALHWDRVLGDELSFVERASERNSLFSVVDRLLSPGQRAAEQHLQHWFTDLAMIGRGKDVLRGLMGRDHGQTARYRAQDGYLSLEEDEALQTRMGSPRNVYAQRHQRFLEGAPEYHAAVDRLDAEKRAFGDAEWMNPELARINDLDLIRAIAAEVRDAGAEFVLVILPSQSSDRPFEQILMDELGALVLTYNQPDLYPRLYEPGLRFDSGHLAAEGAQHFSRLLARDYAGQGGERYLPEDGDGRVSE